jgi:hypothetical protein
MSPTSPVADDFGPDMLARMIDFEGGGLALAAVYRSHFCAPRRLPPQTCPTLPILIERISTSAWDCPTGR